MCGSSSCCPMGALDDGASRVDSSAEGLRGMQIRFTAPLLLFTCPLVHLSRQGPKMSAVFSMVAAEVVAFDRRDVDVAATNLA